MQDGTPIIIRKKKAHKHGHHGGAWKVAYADFVTAMMAFFMVMWILGMSQEQKDSIAAYFNDPIGFTKQNPTYQPSIGLSDKPAMDQNGDSGTDQAAMISQENREVRELKNDIQKEIEQDEELKKLLDHGSLEVKQTAEGLMIELIENETNGEIFFELGSAEVRPQARAIFAKIAPIIARSNRLVSVYGHTDSRPYPGTGYNNYWLSSDRANAVLNLMVQNGVDMKNVTEVVGKADTEPRVPSNPRHFSNRRVAILLPYTYQVHPNLGLDVKIKDPATEGVFVAPDIASKAGSGN